MRPARGKVPLRLPDWIWLLASLLLASLWCVSASSRLGATFDEPNYLANGLKAWHSGGYAALLRQGTMPLPVDVITLPLVLRERTSGVRLRIQAGRGDLRQDDLRPVLPLARRGTLLFAWILIVYGWLLGRDLAGIWGGRLAAAFLATEPSILAHAALATTDVAVTACLVALAYHFGRGRGGTWPWRVGLPGVWFGLALLSKASAIVYAPLMLLVLGAGQRLAQREITPGEGPFQEGPGSRLGRLMAGVNRRVRKGWLELKPLCRDLAWILAIGGAVALLYVGMGARPDPGFVRWAKALGDHGWARPCQWLSRQLRIFPNALTGILWQIAHNSQGHGAFLLGRRYAQAIWFYFPVAFAIKLTLPLLLAPLLLRLARPRGLANPVLACSLVLLAGSVFFRVQIGIRMILPIVALYAVGVAAAIAAAARSLAGLPRRCVVAGTALGLAWIVLSAVRVWPQGLCYANELWGGTAKGYLRLSDSNYDWGQGLRELDQWCRARGIKAMDLWYFGTDPARDLPPFRALDLQDMEISGPGDIRAAMGSRFLAVGTTILHGSYGNETLQRPAAILRALRPVGRTTTFFIYSFPGPATPG